MVQIALRAAGSEAVSREPRRIWQQRHCTCVDGGAHITGCGEFGEMAEQAETGHVGCRRCAGSQGHARRVGVQAAHLGHSGLIGHRQGAACGNSVGFGALQGGGQQASAERLGEHERLARLPACIGQQAAAVAVAARSGDAGDRHAVGRLRRVDGVAAGDHPAPFSRGVAAAGQHLAQQVQRQDVTWPAGQVEREQRRGAHGVDVAGSVGRGDAAPRSGIVHDRREEVGGADQQLAAVEPPDGGVVAGVGADDQVGMRRRSQMAQHLRQLGRPELARSARTMAVLAQPKGRRRVAV